MKKKLKKWKKAFAFTACLAAMIASIGAGSEKAMAANNNITATVDNSVDKSTTRVKGVMVVETCDHNQDMELHVYESGYTKVDYSNPKNDYIQSLIERAKAEVDALGAMAGSIYKGYTVAESTSSYDHRIYSWVMDEESADDVIIIGDEDDSNNGSYTYTGKNRHMVIEGDYAYNLVVTVTGTVVVDHKWDDGVVTQEATAEEEGVLTYTCSVCKGTKTESIPKTEPVEEDPDEENPDEENPDEENPDEENPDKEDSQDNLTQIDITGPIPVIGEAPIYNSGFYSFSPNRFRVSSVGWYQKNYDGNEYTETTTFEPGNYNKISMILDVRYYDDPLYGDLTQIKTVTYNGNPAEFQVIDDGYAILMEYTFDPMMQTIEKPSYKGDITADGKAHSLNEFYDLGTLPKNTYYMGKNTAGEYVCIPLEEAAAITVTDPVEDQFLLRLPVGYKFTGDKIEMECPYKVLEAEPVVEPVSYKITAGDGQNYILGSGETLTFTCDAALEYFEDVKIDDVIATKSSYSAVSGSTVLTLTTEYLDSLAVGKHSIQFLCSNGESNKASFTVEEAEEDPDEPDDSENPEEPADNEDSTENPDEPDKPVTPGNSETTDNSNTPSSSETTDKPDTTANSGNKGDSAKTTNTTKTGDTNLVIVLVALIVLAAGGLLIAWGQRKRSIRK